MSQQNDREYILQCSLLHAVIKKDNKTLLAHDTVASP